MKISSPRLLIASLAVITLGLVATPDRAAAGGVVERDRTFQETLTLGESFSVSARDCALSVLNQSATSLDIGCFQNLRSSSSDGRITLERNQSGNLRAKGCALAVTVNQPRYVSVQCVAVEPAQRFVGSVRCKLEGSATRSRVWKKTKLFLEKPIVSSGSAGSGRSKRWYAAQIGGLASTLGGGDRSQLTFEGKIGASPAGPEESIDFKVAATLPSGRFDEAGSWKFGVDWRGRATLQGSSTAVFTLATNGWRANCRWFLTAAKEPVGPISTKMIEKRLTPPKDPPPARPTALVPASGDANCGGVFSASADGAWVYAATMDMVPGASTVFSYAAVAAGIAGSKNGSSCLSSTLDNMNQQLATQAYEIQQIQTYLGLATNVFYYDWFLVQLQIESIYVKGWSDSLARISPRGASPNAFGTVMETLGLWDQYLNPASGAITDPQQLAASLTPTDFAILQSQISAAEIGGFSEWVSDFSGTEVVLPTPTCTTNCSLQVTDSPGSYLIQMYKQLFSTLKSNIDVYAPPAQAFNVVANQDVVPLYENYNVMLVDFYQQALVGLQQAFTMESLVNQMNYFRAADTADKTQLSSFGQVGGTLYRYRNLSPLDEADAYNKAQQNLAKLYAQRINQLYLNTLNYVVSDVPVSSQAYPTAPISFTVAGESYTTDPVDYAGEVSKSLPAGGSGVQGKTPLSLLAQAADGPWKSAAVLYQFSGLHDVSTCLGSLEDYNEDAGSAGGTLQEWLQLNPGACPSILVLADGSALNQAYYDGNTLAPYTGFQAASTSTGGPMVRTGTMTNNLKFCDPSSPALGWYTPTGSAVGNVAGLEAGRGYLNCGHWYVPGQSSCGFPRANCPASDNPSNGNPYETESYPSVYVGNTYSTQGCTNNLSMNGDNYPWILTLTNGLPPGSRTCASAILSVKAPSGNELSPLVSGSRIESGNFSAGSADGCSLGFFGTGISNRLPRYGEGPGTASFGMRLPNVSNSGGAGAGSGWVMPMQVKGYCKDSHPMTFISMPSGRFSELGVACSSPTGDRGECVIPDGTTYEFAAIVTGNSITLNVNTLP